MEVKTSKLRFGVKMKLLCHGLAGGFQAHLSFMEKFAAVPFVKHQRMA